LSIIGDLEIAAPRILSVNGKLILRNTIKTLRQDAFDNMAVDVSEAVVATLVEVGEAFVVHA